QALRTHAQRSATPQEKAIRVHPRAHLGDDTANGGATGPQAPLRCHGVDRLGSAAVRLRLPALGLRRSLPRLPRPPVAGAPPTDPRPQPPDRVPAPPTRVSAPTPAPVPGSTPPQGFRPA